jgi:hypothetical protein
MRGPLRCPACGQTDFFVISTGVKFSSGSMVEFFRWPETSDELPDEGQLEEVLEAAGRHAEDGGYHVDQEILREPEVVAIEGPLKAMCAACLKDLTEQYIDSTRDQSLPV